MYVCDVLQRCKALTSYYMLTVKEAADQTGLSEWTIRQAIREKRLRATKEGGEWGISPADLSAFMDARKQPNF